jgi:hypothetical protein
MLNRERTQRQDSALEALVRAAGALNDGFTSEHVALALVETGRAMLHLVAMDVNDGEHARKLVEQALDHA